MARFSEHVVNSAYTDLHTSKVWYTGTDLSFIFDGSFSLMYWEKIRPKNFNGAILGPSGDISTVFIDNYT